MEQKFGSMVLALDLYFHRKIQVTRVQSSIKETNHLPPETLGTVDGPQISL